MNIVSTRESANLQAALTVLKVALVLVVAGACFASVTHGGVQNFRTHFAGARGGFAGFMIALTAALWAYDGWSDVTQMAGEIRHPQRALPLALIGGVAAVGVLYMLTSAALQYVMPAAAIATSERRLRTPCFWSSGVPGRHCCRLASPSACARALSAAPLSGARVPFAAAQDGLFPRALAAVHPRFKTPANALMLQAALSSLLIVAVGAFQSLFSLTIFSEWAFYALTTASVFIFRRREPATPRPYRVQGYPVVPALFILAALVLLVFSFMDQPLNSGIGAAVILCGIPAHYLYRHRSA